MNAAILRLSCRSLLGRARVLVLLGIPLALIALAVLLRAAGGEQTPQGVPLNLVRTVGLGVVVPVVTLLGITTLVTSETDDGSILYLLSKPIPRISIIATKVAVVLASAALFAALPMAGAMLIMVGTAEGVWLGAVIAAVVSSVAYAGIFVALAMLVKRSLIGCLLYWLVWEATISALIAPARWLSARAYGNSLLDWLIGTDAHSTPPAAAAVVAPVLVLIAGVAFAGRRLARSTLAEI